MATRTLKLGSGQTVAGVGTTVFTVPVGFTYIVKSIFLFNNNPGGDTPQVQANDSSGSSAVILYGTVIASAARYEWNGWLVLAPGDSFFVASALGNTLYWVSGVKLPGVA